MLRDLFGVPVLHAGVNPVNGLTNSEIISTEKPLMDNFHIIQGEKYEKSCCCSKKASALASGLPI